MKLNMLLNNPLGANSAPIGLNKKEIWPAIIGAIGAIAGAGIAGLSASSANKTNRDIAEGVNEANKSINDTQLQFAKDQYNRERLENRFLVDQSWQREIENRTHQEQFNSPVEQIARLRAAGINPYLAMLNGGSLGSVSSSVSTTTGQQAKASLPSSIPMQTGAPVESVYKDGLGLGLSEIGRLQMQNKLAESDISATRQRVTNETLKTISDLKSSKVQNRYTKALTDKLVKDMLFEDETWTDRIDSIRKANMVAENQATLIKQQSIAQEFANGVAPELHEMDKKRLAISISIAAAQVANINANTALTEQQKRTEIERTSQEAIVRANLPKSLHNDNAIKVQTYKQIKAQADLLKEQAATERWRTIDMFKGTKDNHNSRSMQDYMDYATQALQYTDLNNARGFFRAR